MQAYDLQLLRKIAKFLRDNQDAGWKTVQTKFKMRPGIARKYYNAAQVYVQLDFPEFPGGEIPVRHETVPIRSGKVRLAVTGDWHIGCRSFHRNELYRWFELMGEQGVTIMVHSGDVLDGVNMRPGHSFQQAAPTVDEQLDIFAEVVARAKEVFRQVYFITGNHDQSIEKKTGLSSGVLLQRVSGGFFKYIGRSVGFVTIGDLLLELWHPRGSAAYAMSYHLQKRMANSRSDGLLVGHYHTNVLIPNINGRFGLTVGTFQGYTTYIVEKNIRPAVGAWLLELDFDWPYDRYRMSATFYPFNIGEPTEVYDGEAEPGASSEAV